MPKSSRVPKIRISVDRIKSQYRNMFAPLKEAIVINQRNDLGEIDAYGSFGIVQKFTPEGMIAGAEIDTNLSYLFILAEDVPDDVSLPLCKKHTIEIRGRQLAIDEFDPYTRSIKDAVICYEVRLKG